MDPALVAERAHKLAKAEALLAASERGDSEVVRFYEDATIFVTGASGFLGKQLIEKLLRSCNVKKVYILIREKKETSAQMRLKEILSDPVYDSLHEQKPNFMNKIFAIDGDIGELSLGLTEESWRKITEEVNIIFHVAALVNLNAEIVSSTLSNVRGTREILKLAAACVQLRSLVHVSTAYSHATKTRIKNVIKEDFYDAPVLPETLIKLAENNDVKKLTELLQTNGRGWPNTYTFTKAAAEELVRNQAAALPLSVVRPAIVGAAYREPTPGWVDTGNVFGPSGILLGFITGVIRVMPGNLDVRIDFVPVDVVSNTALVAAYTTAQTHALDNKTNIYTVTNTRKPFLAGDLKRILNIRARKLISPRTMWYCFTAVTDIKALYFVWFWLVHYIPAAIVDGMLLATGHQARVCKLYQKVWSLTTTLAYFVTNDWMFDDSNTLSLYNSLSPTDKDLFNCDMASVDIEDFIEIWLLGLRRYIIKDGLQGTEYGRKKQFYLKILHYFVSSVYLYLIFRLSGLFWMLLVFVFNCLFNF